MKKKKQQKNNQHYFESNSKIETRKSKRFGNWNLENLNLFRTSDLGFRISNGLLFLFIFLLPTQFGKHFFLDFSYLSGIRVDYLAPTLYLTDIVAVILIVINLKTVLQFLAKKKVLLLLAVLFFSLLISRFHPVSLYRYLKIIEFAGIVAVFWKNKTSPNLLIAGFLAGGIVQLFLTTAQFVNRHSLQGMFYFLGERPLSLSLPGIAKASLNGVEILRPYGTFSHPNSLAGFYLLVYFFVLSRYRQISTDFNLLKLISTLLLLVCSLLIFISFSKIAIFTFLLLNIIYLWGSPLKKSCQFCFFARIFILLITSLVFLQAQSDPLSLNKRVQLIQSSLEIIKDNALFGTGLGKYLIVQNQYTQPLTDLLHQPVHNIFLLLLSEWGILISSGVLLISLKSLKKIFLAFPFIIAVILFTGSFDHYWLTLQQNLLLIGVVLGVIL